MRNYYVYILASISKVLYVGVTNDLERRVKEHKSKSNPGFTERYNVNRLVYFEHYTNISDAIIREKEIKRWKRARKVALFIKSNPTWKDLSVDWDD